MIEQELIQRNLCVANERLRWKLDFVKRVLKSRRYTDDGKCIWCGNGMKEECKPDCKVKEALDL